MTPALFRIGGHHPRQLLIIEPLFEEANRTRRTLAQIMRFLDGHGIGSAIPDLPGTGESLVNIADITLDDWRHGVATALRTLSQTTATCRIASFRGGAILDDAAGTVPVFRCAPDTGQRILRDLRRAAKASEADDDGKLAGHTLSPTFMAQLEAAAPQDGPHVHVARLESDAAAAQSRLKGTPIWRRAEPGEDAELTESIANALLNWYGHA